MALGVHLLPLGWNQIHRRGGAALDLFKELPAGITDGNSGVNEIDD